MCEIGCTERQSHNLPEARRIASLTWPCWCTRSSSHLKKWSEGTHTRLHYNKYVGSRTGRSLSQDRGKSELRRAVCRITSGTAGSSRLDGKCHRKHTARAARLR